MMTLHFESYAGAKGPTLPADFIAIAAALKKDISDYRDYEIIVVRLSSATAVGLWGMLLFYTGGPDWLANVFLGLAMLLLLVWRPGVTPAEAPP
jgi:hypothetical protein